MYDGVFRAVFAVMLAACCGMLLHLSKEYFSIGDKAAGCLYIAETLILGLCAVGLLFV